ncbi:disease resistance protein RUN1-like isoform X2 [Vitis riparia]|uniref:disease resistance protein RUN1-like isoform X2 n=1 Tax=Vitis riparia TaxID=96939 RepID=UPI00155A3B42|nr:disease resistance protein RUN1-like isoform X2 [Vitis riparia]
MASSSTSLSVPSSSSTHRWKYDVFLSFRGEDTRQSFTAHLHAALCQKGINTFKDNQLRRGDKISPALLQAIEESRCSIIIFSENYASSSWCLDELTKILECVKMRRQTALPVFHNVDPSHVRKQEGSFAKAFAKHEQVYKDKMEQVVKWRDALTEAATISGWDSRNRDESVVIEEIVARILTEQIDASSSNMDALVGMDSRVEDVVSLLCIGSDDVRMVGIWGMAGIGGTKIFDTRINSIKARLHSRKVLIVLDDVDKQQQLEDLVRNHDWFGLGSRIIITTRDRHLLSCQNVNAIYEAKKLKYDEALELFCQHAFRSEQPTKDFMQLCHRAVDYTGGLPLALKVLGSCLYKKDIDVWKSELDKLKQFPNKEIQNVLKTSFEGLDDNEQNIFLDIAFFYKGHHKDYVKDILNGCGFFFDAGIKSLQDKSLITISEKNKLWMHDLLQEMGWNIVRQKFEVPGERSRLRVHEDINHILTTNTGTEAVEGIFLDLSASEELNFSVEAFAMLKRLRLLRVYTVQIDRSLEYLSEKELIAHTDDIWERRSYIWERRSYAWTRMEHLYTQCKLHLYGDFKFLSSNLRSLYWDGYPLKSLPSNFHPENLVELNMCFSQLKQLWEGKKAFKKLRFIKLSHSQHLTKTPDFSGAPNLSRLILECCTSLVEVHPSVVALKKLIFLNLKGCKKLKNFSRSIHMESLRILTLSGCSKLQQFPEVQGKMEQLAELSLEGTAIKGLPSSIEYLTGLALLNLKECKSLESLPNSIFMLKSLKTLILSNCTRLEKLPEIPENMESLMELFLNGSAIIELPSSIGCLNGLVLLNLKNCKKLAGLPQSICELTSLRTLILCGCSELKELPDDLGSLQCLVELKADGTAIQEVPPSINLLTNLQELSLAGCKGWESKSWNLAFSFGSSATLEPLRLPRLSGLYSLKELILSDCNLLEGALPIDLGSLSSLEWLDLSRNSFITIPASLSGLSRLKTLILPYCKSLQSLPELPSSIEYLNAEACTSLETFSCSSSACTLKGLTELDLIFSNCFRLMENEHNDSMKHILLGIQLLASIPKFLGPNGSIYGWDYPENEYNAIVPGSRIPEWFVDQSTGSSVTVELPPHWNNTKLMGMAVCAVVGAKGVIDPTTEKRSIGIYFNVDGSTGIRTGWTASLSLPMRTDHTWFGYRPLAILTAYSGDFGKSRGSMVVSFRVGIGKEKVEVKKCGVRLVYEGEEKDSHCSFPCGAMWPEEREETDSECSFPGEGDESDSGSEDLRQSNSDSESKELRQTCSPCNLLTNFFMLLKQICVTSKEKADLSQSNSVYP